MRPTLPVLLCLALTCCADKPSEIDTGITQSNKDATGAPSTGDAHSSSNADTESRSTEDTSDKETQNRSSTETVSLPPTGTNIVKVWPADSVGIVVPEVTPTYVTPAWELAFLKNYTNGFSLQPRISIELSDSDLDLSTFTSENVYLRKKGTDVTIEITQRIWDASTRSLHFLPRRYLSESATYEIVTTEGLTANGKPVPATVTAFTTGSYSQDLITIREWLDNNPPQTHVVDTQSAAMTQIWTVHRASLPPGTAPILEWGAFEAGAAYLSAETYAQADGLPVPLIPGANGKLAGVTPPGSGPVRIFQRYTIAPPLYVSSIQIGHFDAPNYLTDERIFQDALASPGGYHTVYYTLYIPMGAAPAKGWPVALYGNGYRSHRHNAHVIAQALAKKGVATMAINALGHGGGPDGTIQLGLSTVPDGGRATDTNNDGYFDLEEGMRAAWDGPNHVGVRGLTDGVRQTAVDFMAASRLLSQGIAGISKDEKDRSYFGMSNGGRYGALLMAADPTIQTAVLNVPPSDAYVPIQDVWRNLWGFMFDIMLPPLTNAPHPELDFFTEDIPARDGPVQEGLTSGAEEIQAHMDRLRWATMPMNTAIYAPLHHASSHKILIQVARGDSTVVNPSTADLIEEWALQTTTCLTWPQRSLWRQQLQNNWLNLIHLFTFLPYTTPTFHPGVIAQGSREQAASFIESRGLTLLDPDPTGNLFGKGDVFEVPLSADSLKTMRVSFGYEAADL